MFPLTIALVLLLSSDSLAFQSSTLPEDLHAFPKYKIQFLQGHPVLNLTAQRWLQDGLVNEQEFLAFHKSPIVPRQDFKGIASGSDELAAAAQSNHHSASKPATATLERLRLGSADYLCLLLPTPEITATPEEATQQAPQPIQTWELLQPLEGTCLYHRQGWFSYSYCHGQHIRQFREKEPHLPIGLINLPAEDPNEPSYTLGHAPATVNHDEDAEGHVSVPEQAALASRLELARGAGHRYLTLHWGDGTVCDKTGKKRETEIQFHCSMTTTDSIFFIKETKTCQYTLVIHTPRLCGQPGFKSPREDLRDTPLRCRKIVETLEDTDPTLPDSPLPSQRRVPKPLPAPRKEQSTDKKHTRVDGKDADSKDARSRLIKAALDALLGRQTEEIEHGAVKGKAEQKSGGGAAIPQDGKHSTARGTGGQGADKKDQRFVAVSIDENGQINIDRFLAGDEKAPAAIEGALDGEEEVMEISLTGGEDATRLMEILERSGYNVRLAGQSDEEEDDARPKSHDEL